MADSKDAEAEITLETYDKHHVKVPKGIATRSAIINMMIEGELQTCARLPRWRALPTVPGLGPSCPSPLALLPPSLTDLRMCRHRRHQRGRAACRQELYTEHHQPCGHLPQEARRIRGKQRRRRGETCILRPICNSRVERWATHWLPQWQTGPHASHSFCRPTLGARVRRLCLPPLSALCKQLGSSFALFRPMRCLGAQVTITAPWPALTPLDCVAVDQRI